MNLVMDDFYHAHAHSLRLMCIEECGKFFANSYVGDYILTRTGNTEETRNGDVTRTITGNVTESIENGSVTINNNLMGETVTEMMPTGDYKTEIIAAPAIRRLAGPAPAGFPSADGFAGG